MAKLRFGGQLGYDRSLLTVSGAASGPTYSQEVLTDTPLGYWKLDETSGTSAADSSGNTLTGTHTSVSALPTVNQTPLVTIGKAVLYKSLAGNLGWTNITHNALLNVTNTFTLEFWVKLTSVGATQTVMGKGAGGAFSVFIVSGGNILLYRYGDGNCYQSTSALSTATTYHVAITKSGSTTKCYVNGVDTAGTVTDTVFTNNSGDLFLGRDSSGGSSYLDGVLDEVAIYATSLSQARVQAHYAARTS